MFYLTGVPHIHNPHLLYFLNAVCISSVLVKETGHEMCPLTEEAVSNCVVITTVCLGSVTRVYTVPFLIL